MKRFQRSVMPMVTVLLLAGPIIPQQIVAQQNIAQQSSRSVVIHAGRVLDVKSGKLLADQALIIEDGKITRVGGFVDTKAPADALRIDLPNATILPGLIDAHTHLTSDPKFGYDQLGISVARETLIGAKNARATLEAGFTTVRNVGAAGYSDVALRDAINAGPLTSILGPGTSPALIASRKATSL